LSAERGEMLSTTGSSRRSGEGGMGVVCAEDTVLNRTVAIKLLPADLALDEERRRMFLDEARLAASGEPRPHCPGARTRARGRSRLHRRGVRRVDNLNRLFHGRPFPPGKVADLGPWRRVSLVHRKDSSTGISSGNILVTAESEVKIVDFGLAVLFERRDATRSPAST
jgi:serine/threonine-protein kinase